MLKKLFHILKVVISGKQLTEETKKSNLQIRFVVSLTLASVALILSIVNILTKEYAMMASTLLLTVSFGFCCLLIKVFNKQGLAEVITSLTIMLTFSYYAISGNNEGFAILWILLVPAVSSLFLSYKASLFISFYFLIFVLVLFYTPVKTYFPGIDEYRDQFIIRFPVLYFSSLVLSLILSTQSIYFSIISQRNSLYDFLTDLKNRRYANDIIEQYQGKKLDSDFTVLSLDINYLKTLNDQYGHDVGDKAISATANILKSVFKGNSENLYRMGGDEFNVFFFDKNDEVEEFVKKIKDLASNQLITKNVKLSISIGYVKSRDYVNADIPTLMKIAETNMYKDKESFYLESHIERRKSTSKVEMDQFNKDINK